MTVKACVDCVFSHYETVGDRSLLECRRHAPRAWLRPEADPLDYRQGWWPLVPPVGWCGEYRITEEQAGELLNKRRGSE